MYIWVKPGGRGFAIGGLAQVASPNGSFAPVVSPKWFCPCGFAHRWFCSQVVSPKWFRPESFAYV